MPTYRNLDITEQLLDDLRFRDNLFTTRPVVYPEGILKRRPHDNDIQGFGNMSYGLPYTYETDRPLHRSNSYHRRRPERRQTRFVDDLIEERTRRGPEIIIPITRARSPQRRRNSNDFRYSRTEGVFVADPSPRREQRRYAIDVPPLVHQELRRSEREFGAGWRPFVLERTPQDDVRHSHHDHRHRRRERTPDIHRGTIREEVVRKTYLDEWGRPFTVEKRKLV